MIVVSFGIYGVYDTSLGWQ